MKKILTLSVLVSLSLLMTGCTTNVANKNVEFSAKKVETENISVDMQMPVATFISENKLVLTNGGSSSCPPVVESVVSTDANEIKMNVKTYEQVCTADYKLISYEISFKNVNSTDKTLLVCSSGAECKVVTVDS